MGILILPPTFEDSVAPSASNEDRDSDGDASMLEDEGRPAKRMKLGSEGTVVPGETITDEPQWMRYNQSSHVLHVIRKANIFYPPAATAPTMLHSTPL